MGGRAVAAARAAAGDTHAVSSVASHVTPGIAPPRVNPHAPAHRAPIGLRAGWARAAWLTPTVYAAVTGLVILVRWLTDNHPIYAGDDASALAIPLSAVAFTVGMGAFDYWARWIAGRDGRIDPHADHGAYSVWDYFKVNTDHKVIGVQYFATTLTFFFIGGALAEGIRAELAQTGVQYFGGDDYNALFSVHAALMIFLFVIPMYAGFANYIMPLMIGAEDMAFPRLNALAFWLLPTGGIIILAGYAIGPQNAGWTAYAPLSVQGPLGNQMYSLGLQIVGASSIMGAVNFMVTIITMRAPGMSLWRMPLFVWAVFVQSVLVLVGTPFVAGAQFMVLYDRLMETDFFNATANGDPVLYQHVFWFYSHPAVYIMILPGFGIISEVVSVFSRKPIFGYKAMALSLIAIALLGFSVWAHHMFVSGMASWLRVPMMIASMVIAVPTGVKVFSWLGTMWQGRIHMTTAMLFAIGFVFTFVIGGLSGIVLAMVPLDIHLTDSYYVVAHIHYVFFGGSVFTVFAGLYYWYPRFTGRRMNERLGRWHFWLTFIFTQVTFLPMHFIGFEGMPRRVADYAQEFETINLIESIGAFGLGLASLIFLFNFIWSWSRGQRVPHNPWGGMTLEWQLPTPTPIFNFDEPPQVVGSPYAYGTPGAKNAIVTFHDRPDHAAASHGSAPATHAEPSPA